VRVPLARKLGSKRLARKSRSRAAGGGDGLTMAGSASSGCTRTARRTLRRPSAEAAVLRDGRAMQCWHRVAGRVLGGGFRARREGLSTRRPAPAAPAAARRPRNGRPGALFVACNAKYRSRGRAVTIKNALPIVLAHVPDKRIPVFRKAHAPMQKIQGAPRLCRNGKRSKSRTAVFCRPFLIPGSFWAAGGGRSGPCQAINRRPGHAQVAFASGPIGC